MPSAFVPSGLPSDVDVVRRVYTVEELGLVDGATIPEIDNLTLLAASIFSAPVSLLSIVQPERDRQFFTSSNGLAEPVHSERQTPLSHSFCQHVVARNHTLIVGDSRKDPLVADNPSVDELDVIAYLGTPVYVDGQPVGALCVIDEKPRLWRDQDAQNLERLGACVSYTIEARARRLDHEKLHRELNALTERLS